MSTPSGCPSCATLRAEVERLTRERGGYREKRANENENLRARVAEVERERDEAYRWQGIHAEVITKVKPERDAALARVGVLEAAARVAEFDLRSIRMDLSDMTQVSRVQRVMDRLRVALAPGKGEP